MDVLLCRHRGYTLVSRLCRLDSGTTAKEEGARKVGCSWWVGAEQSHAVESADPPVWLLGVLLLTSGLVMLIYALTTGSTDNVWKVPGVIAPLVISVAGLLPAFFWWETRISPNDALVPPSTWRLPGFGVLFAVAMTIYGWFQSVCVPFTVLWQEPIARGGYGNSAIESALKL